MSRPSPVPVGKGQANSESPSLSREASDLTGSHCFFYAEAGSDLRERLSQALLRSGTSLTSHKESTTRCLDC